MRIVKVVGISFYAANFVPASLLDIADEQGFSPTGKLIAVKTVIQRLPPQGDRSWSNGMYSIGYVFENVGSTPKDIKEYIAKLAEEDGENIGKALSRAFS